jgi:hypothetical protein
VEKGRIAGLTVPDWLDRVRKRPSERRKASRARISSLPSTAPTTTPPFVKVRCQLPPRYFTDYLVAMKLKDGWKIVSKSYRYDLKE